MIDASNSIAISLPSLFDAGKEYLFTVEAYDNYGNRELVGGANISLSLTSFQPLNYSVLDHNKLISYYLYLLIISLLTITF